MKRMLIALLLLAPLATVFNAEELTDKNYETVKAYILPKGEEEHWKNIEWRATFWDGVVDAQKLDKPIMLFTMNGHPFGCV